MSIPNTSSDRSSDDSSSPDEPGEADVTESTSGEGVTIGGQLGALPLEVPTAGDEGSSDSDGVGDLDPTNLDGSADEVEQQVRENGAP